jgi:sulfatase modifying factor 1
MTSTKRMCRFWPGAVGLVAAAVFSVVMLATETHAGPIVIDWVTVGNPGNANDTVGSGYGAVAEEFRIGKYEVTIAQYTDFLNAVAKTDTYSLYNTSMGSSLNIAGISRSGTSGNFSYSVIGPSGSTPAGASSPGNRPITFVSWFDAARFANWMHNGQGSGSTETGAYTLNGATIGDAVAKNSGALYWLPTENEWYKAAYYSPVLNSGSGGYYAYATQSNTAPGNTIGSGTNQANYNNGVFSVTQAATSSSSQNYLTDVGAFTNSASFYGTFDQSGNVYEWNDLNGTPGDRRGWRGGNWNNNASFMPSSYRQTSVPSLEVSNLGFRLAAVPEPSTYAMALAGLACGGYLVRRRRKRA